MLRYAYDLHIHTAASPCGDEYMSPNNIVNMAKLKGLKVLAITDHQTVCNCKAVMKVGETQGILVIPGIEIMCQEEFHLVALLPSYEIALEVEAYIQEAMPKIENRKSLFGEQLIFNEKDEVIGEISQFLLIATERSSEAVVHKVRQLGGVIYPAHIDRNSYSILSQLGTLPRLPQFKHLEISAPANFEAYCKRYPEQSIIQSSDAHYLQDIAEPRRYLELIDLSIMAVLNNLNQ